MIQLKSQVVGNVTQYQYYQFCCENCEFEICTDYNEPVTINGEIYTPVNGYFEIPIVAIVNADNRLCDVSTKLSDTSSDL